MRGPEFDTKFTSESMDPTIDLTAHDPVFTVPQIPEIPVEQLGGIDLINYFAEQYPETAFINLAMAAEVALRFTADAIATGHDVQFLQAPSQAVLVDVLLSMPLIDEACTVAGKALLEELEEVYHPREGETLRYFLGDFTREINNHTSRFSSINTSNTPPTIEERIVSAENMRSLAYNLRVNLQRVLNKYYDPYSPSALQLAHEGGDISGLIDELYTDFIDRDHASFIYNPAKLAEYTGLSGPARLHLLHEKDYLLGKEPTPVQ